METRKKIKNIDQNIKLEVQDFSSYFYNDNAGIPFQKLMKCISNKVTVLCDGKIYHFDNGEQAIMTLVGKHEVKSVSVHEKQL